MEVITKNASETNKLGQEIGANLKGGEVIALSGEMGAGKTTFVQGLAKGLQIKNKIVSPTFILMRTYNGKAGVRQIILRHLDLYRLENNIETQVRDLGLFDIWGDKNNIVVIEWAEKIKEILPIKTIWINFENLDKDRRKIEIIYRYNK